MAGELVKKQGLTALELSEIKKLAEICNNYEHLNIKLELEWLGLLPILPPLPLY